MHEKLSKMALRTSTCLYFFFTNASRMTSSSFPPKIPFCTTSTMLYDQFRNECNLLLPFTRQIHRTATMMNDSEKEQNSLDQMVNSYPTVRRFIAIGSGGDDFADAMVCAVESVLQEPIPDGSVKKRVSSMGRYISVNIGPVQVTSRDQVKAVYEAMMKDARMRYFF